MGQTALVGSVVSLGAALMFGAGMPDQPGAKAPAAKAAAQPRESELGRFGVTQSEDGRKVFLWGFNGRNASVDLLGTGAVTDAQMSGKMDETPPIYREYYFGSSKDGRRVFVWGYNPGEGRIELVSTHEAQAGERGKAPRNR